MITIRANEFTSVALGVIQKPINAVIREAINEQFTLTLRIVVNDDELNANQTDSLWKLINTNNILEAENQLFDIVKVDRMRDNSGGLFINCEAEHISYRLNSYVFEDEDFGVRTGSQMLQAILNGVPGLQVGQVQVTGSSDFRFQRITRQKALRIVAEQLGGELAYGPRTGFGKRAVHILSRRGRPQGPKLIAGYNISGFQETFDSRDPDGKQFSAKITFAELSKAVPPVAGYDMQLGDIVQIFDPALSVNSNQRVVAYERDLANPEESTVEIAKRADRLIYEVIRPQEVDPLVTDLAGEIPSLRDSISRLLDFQNSLNDRLDDLEESLEEEEPIEPEEFEGELGLYKVLALRAYRENEQEEFELVPVGQETSTDTLKPTWDWVRLRLQEPEQ